MAVEPAQVDRLLAAEQAADEAVSGAGGGSTPQTMQTLLFYSRTNVNADNNDNRIVEN